VAAGVSVDVALGIGGGVGASVDVGTGLAGVEVALRVGVLVGEAVLVAIGGNTAIASPSPTC